MAWLQHSFGPSANRHSLFTLIPLRGREHRRLIVSRELEIQVERGLRAPLSPNEQTALRRVANGISKPKHLRSTSLQRLKMLALVEEHDGRIRLTALGQRRCLAEIPADAMPAASPSVSAA